jgi:peptidyl-prolyl cis-trans isomerase A (cyclophilin A)
MGKPRPSIPPGDKPAMRRRTILTAALAATALMASPFAPPAPAADDDKPVVVLDTNLGQITVELDKAKAPISVENFLKYVDKSFFDGTVFHRVKGDFMIQGGGFKEKDNILLDQRKDAFGPIKNESSNGLSNVRGTIAMARTQNPNSATSQFYINLDDNSRLDRAGGGYAVFGKVISGMDVVDAIAKARTGSKRVDNGQDFEDVPVEPIVVKSVKRKSKS